ncbi:hypothetical protein B488_13580 [Liberibacter crescens BT-1]|uniref:HPr kinase/phosphorylase C-terminal domain-containing protein n=1 Tax=Liberibacter crescens (strain BT-1) TaxID=1215343 RepID=L0EWV9_LIBCB|nr:hypothetical protein [Liberibacter crescens]AGA65350.1 hypothetical protein B488_13580 [Liberibacter crescens BT-1]AMC12290.1 hypothetical protein RL73_00080 [Liberibacter crescens]
MKKLYSKKFNLHATVIAVGTSGIVFIGPSGCGKSHMALQILSIVNQAGHFSALVADDQVFIYQYQDIFIAKRPESISNLIEIRGTGIFQVTSIPAVRLNFAVTPYEFDKELRLPPENETFSLTERCNIPLIRIHQNATNPAAILAISIPELSFLI